MHRFCWLRGKNIMYLFDCRLWLAAGVRVLQAEYALVAVARDPDPVVVRLQQHRVQAPRAVREVVQHDQRVLTASMWSW